MENLNTAPHAKVLFGFDKHSVWKAGGLAAQQGLLVVNVSLRYDRISTYFLYQSSDERGMKAQSAHSQHASYCNGTARLDVILWLLLATSLAKIIKAGAVTMLWSAVEIQMSAGECTVGK